MGLILFDERRGLRPQPGFVVSSDCGYDNGGGKSGDPAGNLDDLNCYFPGTSSERIVPGKHELLTDPLFVDPKKGDFRLKDGSPSFERGVGVGMLFKGKAPDLGAFCP